MAIWREKRNQRSMAAAYGGAENGGEIINEESMRMAREISASAYGGIKSKPAYA